MRFFLETVDADEARRVKDWGLLDGVVVRPDTALAAARDYRKTVADLSQVCDGPVFAAAGVRETGRAAQGVKVIDLDEGDAVVAVAKLPSLGEREEPAEDPVEDPDAPDAPAPAGDEPESDVE